MLGQAADQAQLSFIGQRFHAVRAKLLETDAVIRRSRKAAQAVGKELAQAWQRYSSLVAIYQQFRVLFGLDPEPGLSGPLGVVPIVVGGWTLAALLGAIAALLVVVGALLQRALAAAKTEAALSEVVAQQTGTPGARFTSVTTPSGQVIVVPQEQNFLDWILENPGTAILGVGGFLLLLAVVRRD